MVLKNLPAKINASRTALHIDTEPLRSSKEAITAIETFASSLEKQKKAEISKKNEAAEIAKRYGFAPWQPPTGYYPSDIISLQEFREHPERYAHKLVKGMMGFPLGLNFKGVNNALDDTYHGSVSIGKTSVDVDPARILSHYGSRSEVYAVSETLYSALKHTGLSTSSSFVEPISFLANAARIGRFITERRELSDNEKQKVINYLVLAQSIYLSALEIAGTTRIGDPLELVKTACIPIPPPATLADKIKDALLEMPDGTGEDAAKNLLQIGNMQRFQSLAAIRTAEILFKGTRPAQIEQAVMNELKTYTTGKLLCLASYFSRFIIKQYENHDSAVERVLAGSAQNVMSGQCLHYTALSVHYLQQFIMPLLPDAFHGFRIGYEEDHIGQRYDHVYLKALRVNPDRTVDAYFLDPTFLSQKGIEAMKTPEDIARYASTKNHPVQIRRTAEDLLQRPERPVTSTAPKLTQQQHLPAENGTQRYTQRR